jgi:hypothetical protein
LLLRRAELQLGPSIFIYWGALAPEASGVKTPDPRTLYVGTKVPISETAIPNEFPLD